MTDLRPRWGGLSILLGLTLSCGDPSSLPREDPLLETVEVGAAPDSAIRPEEDKRARPLSPEVAGVLPGDLPKDLPLYLPSSLIDFGEVGGGSRYITLSTPDPQAAVRVRLSRSFDVQGWQREAGEGRDAPSQAYRKGAQRVHVKVEENDSLTVIRIEYVPSLSPLH